MPACNRLISSIQPGSCLKLQVLEEATRSFPRICGVMPGTCSMSASCAASPFNTNTGRPKPDREMVRTGMGSHGHAWSLLSAFFPCCQGLAYA